MTRMLSIPALLRLVLILGCSAGFSQGFAQKVEKQQRPGQLSGLSYRLNHHTTMIQQLILSPNPASSELHVKLPDNSNLRHYDGYYISILDQFGRVVLDQPWYGEKVDVSFLQPGIYIVAVNKERVIYTHKLVIDR